MALAPKPYWKRHPRLFALLAAALLFGIYHYGFGNPFFHTLRFTSHSPGGQYSLNVYERPGSFFFAMPGDGGTRIWHVVLRNRFGWKVGASDSKCEGMMYDFSERSVVWDIAGGSVHFAVARGINLRTGACEM